MADVPRGVGLDAVILAGGRASRLGGVSKPGLRLAGGTLLEHALAAARFAAAGSTVVVGPADLAVPRGVLRVQEHPAFGGPVAGLAAALDAIDAPDGGRWVLLLASDLPRAREATALLLAALPELTADLDGVHLEDAGGRAQWLAGVYRLEALRRELGTAPAAGRSIGSVMRALRLRAVADTAGVAADVDTWEDVAHIQAGEQRGTT